MFVGHESRNRDRFGSRRILNENPRDYYYSHQNVVRIDRNNKEGAKIWPRKQEERDHLHAIEHQKHRSSRTPLDDFGYRSFNHSYQKYPEHHHFRSRSRSPFQPWAPHHRREFSDDRRYERRREVSEIMKPLPLNDIKRSSEHRSAYSKHSDHLKMKSYPISRVRSNLRNASRWGHELRGGSRGKHDRSRPRNIHKRRSLSKSKGSPKSPSKKKSLSRVSSSDFKSSPSTEHLEKQKKYLVDKLAEFEQTRRGSPAPPSNARPKSPPEEDKEDAVDDKKHSRPASPVHSPVHSPASPSMSSLQSFDGREEGHHFNINFPNDDEDEEFDDLEDEEVQRTFEPLQNPELVRMIPPSEFKPFFAREEFKRKKEEGLMDDERAVVREYRRNGLKRDSSDNRKFHVTQVVTESMADASESQDNAMPKESETLEIRRHNNNNMQTINLPRRFPPRINQKKVPSEGFDLRQRIHERLQNKQAYEELGSDADKSYPVSSNKGCYRRTEQTYDHIPIDHKPPVRRVVSNSRPIGLISTFSNGSSQPKRSVVLTKERPIATSRFLH